MEIEEKIKKEDIDKIVRIEFMPTSNWIMGYNRRIWVCDIDMKTNTLKRSVYIGDPLVPEYSRTDPEDRKRQRNKEELSFRKGEVFFKNDLTARLLLVQFKNLKIQNWEHYNRGPYMDARNLDIVFYVKGENNIPDVYRYLFLENSADDDTCRLFYGLFATTEEKTDEVVTVNRKLQDNYKDFLPGTLWFGEYMAELCYKSKTTDKSLLDPKDELYEKYTEIVANSYLTGDYEEMYELLAEDVVWKVDWDIQTITGYEAVTKHYNARKEYQKTTNRKEYHTLMKILDAPVDPESKKDHEGKIIDHIILVEENGKKEDALIELEINNEKKISKIFICLPETYCYEEYRVINSPCNQSGL